LSAYEMVNGEYYEQGSDEYYAALNAASEPTIPLGTFLGRFLKANGVKPESRNGVLHAGKATAIVLSALIKAQS